MSKDVLNEWESEKLAEIEQLKRELSAANATIATLRYDLRIAHECPAAQEAGWNVIGDDGDWNRFDSEWEAENHAKACAKEGIASTVVRVTKQYPAEQIEDWCTYNGVTPGVDCPETLNQPRAA